MRQNHRKGMKVVNKPVVRRVALLVALACGAPLAGAQTPSWTTIVNNGMTVPGTTATFNSYNQPAINSAGLVVFRARGKATTGGGGSAAAAADTTSQGVYTRDMATLGPIVKVASRGDVVPAPNNLAGTFNEFPSSPRIDATSASFLTRGMSTPLYSYLDVDGVTELRVGSAGVYANVGSGLITAASIIGAVVENGTLTFPWFTVPDAQAGTKFDVFPGSPSIAGNVIVFKGNYTDPVDSIGKTGAYYRDVVANGAHAATMLIAGVHTVIPNQTPGGSITFGATAAPSAANGYAAFTGWDNEDAPAYGGVYRAALTPSHDLQKLAGIGDAVPGETGQIFLNFGEGLSMSEDGRYVAFWGTWGTETTAKTLICPTDGNADLIAFCNTTYPHGYVVNVPVHQGIFVADAQSGDVTPIAKTGQDGITDFVYWGFSGAPPTSGTGDEGREPARWRSSAFAALSGKPGHTYGAPTTRSKYQVAFKGARNGVDGIYLRRGSIAVPLETAVETLNTTGQSVDPLAPAGSIVTAVGIERDGFRDGNLAVAVSMLYETVDTSLGWAGLYLMREPALTAKLDFNGDGKADLVFEHPNGVVEIRLMDGVNTIGSSTFAPSARGHIVSTTGDFNADGKADLLFQRDDGGVEMWLMDGTALTSVTTLMSPGSAWRISHVGDFDGDGHSDILWRSTNGSVGLWLMNGSVSKSRTTLMAEGSQWTPTHVGDFNRDGRADIVWRHADGTVSMWLMNGSTILDRTSIMAAGKGWNVLLSGDFNGDGMEDLVWQHNDGTVGLWMMSGHDVLSKTTLMSSNPTWTVTHAADFNGDGKSDLMWLARDGTAGMWLMNGGTVLERKTEMSAPTLWRVAVAEDMNGDGKSDLVWSETTGATGLWVMNGTSLVQRLTISPQGWPGVVVPVRFER